MAVLDKEEEKMMQAEPSTLLYRCCRFGFQVLLNSWES